MNESILYMIVAAIILIFCIICIAIAHRCYIVNARKIFGVPSWFEFRVMLIYYGAISVAMIILFVWALLSVLC